MHKKPHHFSQMEKKVSLSHMSITKLAASWFITTQTEEKLKRDNIINQLQTNQVRNEIDTKVRETISELKGEK